MERILTRFALLCGSAPDGFTQKKIEEMHSFLSGSEGGWEEKDILIFPNGISEKMLALVLARLKSQKTDYVLLYICAEKQAEDDEKIILGGEKINRRVIEAAFCDESWQAVFDSCGEFVK